MQPAVRTAVQPYGQPAVQQYIRRPYDPLSSFNRLEETTAAKHADILITIKVQTVVELKDGELFLECIFNLLRYNSHFVRIRRIILLNGAHQLHHQNVVDLFGSLPFEGQVQMPYRLQRRTRYGQNTILTKDSKTGLWV